MIRVCRTDKITTMRNLMRSHAVSVAYLHEVLTQANFRLQYEQSERQAADTYTKPSFMARCGITVPAPLALAIRRV